MMHIKVNDGYFFYLLAISAHDIGSCNCYVIDVTEAIGLFLITLIVFESFSENTSMMAWWSYRTKRVLELL